MERAYEVEKDLRLKKGKWKEERKGLKIEEVEGRKEQTIEQGGNGGRSGISGEGGGVKRA